MNDRLFTLPKKLAERHHTRDPFVLADLLGFSVRFLDTKVQKGFCANILNNYFIFINQNLSPEMQRMTCAHELGHVLLHKDRPGRDEHGRSRRFVEMELFNITDETEYEANLFAANLLVDDETLLELLRSGQDIVAAARALGVNVNLLAIKLAEMKKAGLPLNDLPLSPDRTFLGRIADSAGSL
jgi:Zn-dependent peptidase ImmA (M78 family)